MPSSKRSILVGAAFLLSLAPAAHADFVRAVSGRGRTEEAALRDAKDRAVSAFHADISSLGQHACSPLPNRDPEWFCEVDFTVNAPSNAIRDTASSANGMGPTKAEAIFDARENARHGFDADLASWGEASCEEVPNRQPSWKCSVDFTSHVRPN
jgi:hypothetical protein